MNQKQAIEDSQSLQKKQKRDVKSIARDSFYKAVFKTVGFRHSLNERQISLIRSKHLDTQIVRKLKLSEEELTQILDNVVELRIVDICFDQVSFNQKILKNPELELKELRMLILRGNQFTNIECLQSIYMPALTTFQFTSSLVSNIKAIRKMYIPNATCIHISTIFQKYQAKQSKLEGVQGLNQLYARQSDQILFTKIDHQNYQPIEYFPKSYPKIQFISKAKKASLINIQKIMKQYIKRAKVMEV